ncbi:CDP-glucose 4,6-dehydratase [Flexilinea flocculi]|uniref:CDP-glucose 4,6-dehydratase n=1 Tax=Flexilinea flocculi TaxID=1678840 RepID=A0A0K8PA13_9CHLR|nr:CDP-glucose 4,6-dehydratase [Flexilinea flocculi]GAP39476.1 CDP-glucose 4,6-dehydratase [Flexilinea flocculi]
MIDLTFYRGKKVFVTGHTGFKGTWLCMILAKAGAEIIGYSLPAPTEPNLFSMTDLEKQMTSVIGDIRDISTLSATFQNAQPEIVFHLAAQPIVRESYRDPAYTYEVNVMGIVNILECVRRNRSVKSFLNITTDKVYQNNEWAWGYRETDPLDGLDPYSNSKSCSELITHSYKNSFFLNGDVAVSTARAGNVIGGGDFASDRIIPDCLRAIKKGETIIVRNPHSTRPYQHVLEPLFAYLLIAQKQFENRKYANWYNVGPDECDCVTTGALVELFCSLWGNNAKWESRLMGGPHEASFLKLDCSKIKSIIGWTPRWHITDAVEKTCEWAHIWLNGGDIPAIMNRQIDKYLEGWN